MHLHIILIMAKNHNYQNVLDYAAYTNPYTDVYLSVFLLIQKDINILDINIQMIRIIKTVILLPNISH